MRRMRRWLAELPYRRRPVSPSWDFRDQRPPSMELDLTLVRDLPTHAQGNLRRHVPQRTAPQSTKR